MTPDSKISLVANVWIKQMLFNKAGDINEGHSHNFDHQTLLAYGAVEVDVDGKISRFDAPTIIFIKAGKKHQIKATKDGTVCYCIHPIRNGERIEDIIDPDDIPVGVSIQKGLTEGEQTHSYYRYE